MVQGLVQGLAAKSFCNCNTVERISVNVAICSLRGSMPFSEKTKNRNAMVVLIMLGMTITSKRSISARSCAA